jgi:hypothetical protein
MRNSDTPLTRYLYSRLRSHIFIVRCFKITDQTVWKEKLFLWFGFEFIHE